MFPIIISIKSNQTFLYYCIKSNPVKLQPKICHFYVCLGVKNRFFGFNSRQELIVQKNV